MPVKWGVIGAGGIADRRTIPEGIVLCEDAQLVALQDINHTVLSRVQEKYKVGTAYPRWEALLGDPKVQAVYIATPTTFHYEQVMAAAKAGKHVLCEKPLALTLEQCQDMVDACAKAGVLLGVNFMTRFHPCHQLLKQMIEAGDLGKLVFGRAELTCWYPPIPKAFRQDPTLGGGGSFIDMGNHCVDLLEQFFGRVVEVNCFTGNLVQDYASEDTAVAMLKFGSGAIGVVDALFNVPDAAARNQLEVYGSKGSVCSFGTIGQGSAGKLIAVLQQGDKAYDPGQARGVEAHEAFIEPPEVNVYRSHIQAFCDAITNGTPPPIPGEEGVWSHKVIAACYKSVATHTAVMVE